MLLKDAVMTVIDAGWRVGTDMVYVEKQNRTTYLIYDSYDGDSVETTTNSDYAYCKLIELMNRHT